LRRTLADIYDAVASTQSVGGELTNRMAGLWAPVAEVSAAADSVQEMRDEYERFMAQAPLPADVEVRPVTAGGVPSLVIGGEPSTLYLHGGGFMVGSAYGYRPLVGAFVGQTGGGALVPDFRLAPEHPFPAALEDVLSAYRWLVDQRGDASKVML